MVGVSSILAICLAAAPAPVEPPPAFAWPVGEILVYEVTFTWISAGTATMTIYDSPDVAGTGATKLYMRTVSKGFARSLAAVDDVATSWIDSRTGAMLEYTFDMNEDDRQQFERLTAAPSADVVAYYRKKKGKEKRVDVKRIGEGPALDTLSLFYYLRTIPIEIDTPIELTVYQGDEAFGVTLTATKIEKVKLKGVGHFSAFRVKAESATPGLFSDQGDVTFWIEKNTHTLLKSVIGLRVGSTGMLLTKVRNSPLLDAPGAAKRKK
jgi:hypothetical protein